MIDDINACFLEFWVTISDFLISLLNTLFDALKDLFLWMFEQMLDLSIFALNGLGDSFSTFNPATYIAALPPEIVNITGLIGLGEAATILVTAIVLRMLLQVIPFVRFGS